MFTPDTLLYGRYQIRYAVDDQSAALVYRALDQQDALSVLMAELPRSDANSLQAVERLARQIAAFQVDGLLPLRDHFASEEALFLVAADPGGQDLERVVRTNGETWSEAQVFAQVVRLLQVLDLVHAAQPPLYLGELRSPDLWTTPEGELALVPFVFARPRQSNLSPYCAPELAQFPAQLTPAADIYVLAAVMYHLLTGWPPPTAEQRRAGVPLNPPRTLNAQITPLTEQMLLRALDLTPANRYQHVRELRCAMEVVLVLSAHAPELERVSAPLTPLPTNPPTDPPPVVLPTNLATAEDIQPLSKPAATQRSNACLMIIVALLALVALGICVTGIWLLTGPGQELLR